MQIKFRSTHFLELQTGLFILLIGAAGLAVALLFPAQVKQMPACLFRIWTGIPCPVCGATHAGLELGQGHLIGALAYNPFFTLVYLYMILASANAVIGLVFKKRWDVVLTPRERQWLTTLLLAALPLNWVFLIARRLPIF